MITCIFEILDGLLFTWWPPWWMSLDFGVSFVVSSQVLSTGNVPGASHGAFSAGPVGHSEPSG